MDLCLHSNLFFRKKENTLLSDDELLKNDINVAGERRGEEGDTVAGARRILKNISLIFFLLYLQKLKKGIKRKRLCIFSTEFAPANLNYLG